MNKVIFYGGSFDPIHNGHLALARRVQAKYDCKLIVIPTNNWMKAKSLFPLEERIAITKKVFEFEKNIEVVDWALTWEKMDSTYECIRQFKEKNPGSKDELYVMLGSDAIEKLPNWDQVDKLAKEVKLIIVHRVGYGYNPNIPTELGFEAHSLPGVGDVSSTQIRKKEVKWRNHIPANVWNLVKGKLD